MSEISDLLEIEHFTTSHGETVPRDFLEAVALALHVPPATIKGIHTKDDLLRCVIEAATGAPVNPELFSVGGTVTNDALRAILKGSSSADSRGDADDYLRTSGAGSAGPHPQTHALACFVLRH